MSKFMIFLRSLLPKFASQKEIDKAYLDGATDIYELEHRMKNIDARQINKPVFNRAFDFTGR